MRRCLLCILVLMVGAGTASLWGAIIASANRLSIHQQRTSNLNLGSPIEFLPPGTQPGSCVAWTQVNDDAFGLGDPSIQKPPYQDEDVFETLVFHDQLYLGMEADNQLGARLWRTRASVLIPEGQGDWEEVIADANGFPFGVTDTAKIDHIDSLAVFRGWLFVSTANRTGYPRGTTVYSSTDGANWTPVITDGFGTPFNENFKDMQIFSTGGTSWLCGGTGNDVSGAQIWCTQDGSSWVQKNFSGFGEARYNIAWSATVMGGDLYVGTSCDENGASPGGACPGAVFRTHGGSSASGSWAWEKVFTATDDARAMLIGPYQEALLVGFESQQGTQIYRSTSGDLGSFLPVVSDGFGEADNARITSDGDAIYNGALYVDVTNAANGTEIWRTTTGITWTQVISDGFGSPETYNADLIPFNGYLYAWAENYWTGQKVYRSKCPIVEEKKINGTGLYEFPGVGATIALTSTDLDGIEVGVYPDAFPLNSDGLNPVKRHYEISSSPLSATFTATLTLTYTQAELDASQIHTGEMSTYLNRWDVDSKTWDACPSSNRRASEQAHSATCSNVTQFSTWAIANSPYLPGQVKYIFLPILLHSYHLSFPER